MDTGILAAASGLSGNVLDFLMQQSLYAAAVAAVVWTVLAVVKPRHPLLHLALWWFVLARLVLPADLAASWSLRAAADRLLAKAAPVLANPQAAVVGLEDAEPVAVAAPPTADALVLSAEPAAAAGGDLLPVAVFLFWLGGAVAMALLLARAERSARQTINLAEPAENPLLEQLADAWAKRFGVTRHVRVLVTQEATAPFTAGVLRPVIVLPRTLLDRLDAVELSAVIGHEMSHIRSFDVVWRMVERVLLVLFFFHPMVWMAVRRIDTAREAASDISAANSGVVARNTYAQSLLAALKAFRIAPEMAFARTLSIQGGTTDGLKTRLIWLKGETAMSTPAKIMGAAGIFGLGLMVLPMAEARQVMPALDVEELAALPAPAAQAPNSPAAPQVALVQAPAAPRTPAAPKAPAAPKTPDAPAAPAAPQTPAPASPEAARRAFGEEISQTIEERLTLAETVREAKLAAAEAQLAAAEARRDAKLAAEAARREARKASAAAQVHREVEGDIARKTVIVMDGAKRGDYSVSSAGEAFALKVVVDGDTIRKETLKGLAGNLRTIAQQMRTHPERFDPQQKGAFVVRSGDGIVIKVAGEIAAAADELEARAHQMEREVTAWN